MIKAVFKFLLHAFRCIMQVQLMTMEAIFVIIISLHSGPNYLILLTLQKVLKFMIMSCCNGNDSQSYNEKDMPLSTPGLTLEMLIENEGSGLVVLCSRVAVGYMEVYLKLIPMGFRWNQMDVYKKCIVLFKKTCRQWHTIEWYRKVLMELSLSLSLGNKNCKRWCKFVALLYKNTPFVVIFLAIKWKTVVVCNFKNQFTILKYYLIILIFCHKLTDW